MADPNTRQGKRTPVTLKIKFKSETLEQFIERYAVDVSQGGIFIRTKEPLAVGTQMKFEFQLRDASPLIAGEGTVVWTRENDPSRPAIAPGMGVRFDKLADGSQSVLEKILSEKAKQAPSRSSSDTGPGANKNAFGDETTKVAPAQVQEQLGLRSRNQDSGQTPLPKPFQSDADDFDEKAFDEATKVRSLDDLALASASDDGSGLDDNPRNMTVIMPADELAARRRVTAEGFDALPASAAEVPRAPSRESAPGLFEPPNEPGARKPPTEDDDFPSPSTDDIGSSDEPAVVSAADSAGASAAKETAKESAKETATPAATAAARPSASKIDSATPRAVASEPSRPTAPSRPSSAPVVIGILVAVAAVIGGVWWFVLRDPGTSKVADSTAPQTPTTDPATTPDKEPIATPGGSGSAVVDPNAHVGSAAGAGSGSAAGAAMQNGSAAGSALPIPVEATVDTVISANAPKGAVVEIVGTDQKGPAPFTAKLEKDKAYTARITAPGFKVTEVDVKAGVKTAAKLPLKPRVLTVVTDPPGADIYVDSFNTQKVTPSDVTLTPGQSAKPRVRVSVRRPGYRAVDQMVDASAFKEAGEGMTHKVEMKLQVAPKVTPPPAGGAGSGSASDTSGGDGGATPPPPAGGDGAGSATP